MQLGLLELGEISTNTGQTDRIISTVALAQHADKLGYSRFWLAEHHQGGTVWRSPEILIPVIATYTKTIKVGAAGILLPLHSPLRVAQNFKMMAALYPNRIDLGIGNGIASENIAKELLNGLSFSELRNNHLSRIKKVIDYLGNDILVVNGEEIATPPFGGEKPDVWILGSSGATMDFAIENKLNYSFSLLHRDNSRLEDSKNIFRGFKEKYSEKNGNPSNANFAISVLCAPSKAEREAIINQYNMGVSVNVIGEFNQCCDEINIFAEKFDSKEIIINLIHTDSNKKKKIIEKLAKAFIH